MKHAICLLSIVPCRSEPDDRSEMVTQLLFGDLMEIKGRKNSWIKIRCIDDNYIAWVDEKQINVIDASQYKKLSNQKYSYSEDLVAPLLNTSDKSVQTIVMGSKIRCISTNTNEFNLVGNAYKLEGQLRSPAKKLNRNQLIEDAFAYLNTPYLWGGKTPMGIDCSGFTQMVYAMNGIPLPRDASQQAESGHAMSFIEEAEEGDLAFFDNSEGRITHVGIMLERHRIIHASGKVRVDRIDHQGIFRDDLNDYSHSLRIIKKLS